jgi:DNA-binding response OmpR family regulator
LTINRRIQGGREKILIVDDEDTIRALLNEAFIKVGYCVRLAANAEEALEALRKEYIPVIFVDLGLEKMNGFELCGIIRKDSPYAFIYALSGNPELFSSHENREAGFDDYFTKPVSLKTLYKVAKDSFEKIQRLTNEPFP